MKTISKNIADLVAFHVTASEGSLTAAAEKMGLSKSMVSKQIKRLETYLGVQLFFRTTRTLGLSAEGRALFQYSGQIVDLSDRAEKTLMDLAHGESGTLRISTPMGLGPAFFSSFLPEISKLLPKVKFDADVSNEARDFVRDGVDFAIRVGDGHDPDMIARYLGHISDVICATPVVAKKANVGNDPRKLAGLECILFTGNPSWNTWRFRSGREEIQVPVEGRYSTNLYQTALSLCLGGQGIARLPHYLAADALAKGDLVQLVPGHEITTHPLYLVYPRTAYPSKKHRVTKEALLAWFKSRPKVFQRKQ